MSVKKPIWALSQLPAAVTSLVVLAYIYRVLTGGGGVSQDFGVYYAAATAVARGLNPYDMEIIQSFASSSGMPFVYPLVTAYLFRPFIVVPFEAAEIFYALIKSLCLVYLIRVWVKHFLPEVKSTQEFVLLAITLAYGLSLSIYSDLAGGNVSILEQTLLWTGLSYFVRGRLGLFCVFVVLAASFKFALAVTLLLLVTTDFRWRKALMYLSFVALAMVPTLSYLLSPEWFGEYLALATIQAGTPRGFMNPSLLSGLVDFPFVSSIKYLPYVLYAAIVIYVLTVTTQLIRRGVSRTETVLLFTIVYALTMPRMSTYSYIILLPAISYLFLSWRIELPTWVLPAFAVAFPIVLSSSSFSGSIFAPWVAWIVDFHHVVLSAMCFAWWSGKLRRAQKSSKTITPESETEKRAAQIYTSVPSSTPI